MIKIRVLPIYNAVSLNEKNLIGGSTKPWLVNVLDAGRLTPFVVKLFKSDHIERAEAVTKEVFGAILAREFDLSTPEMALINFSPNFIETLNDDQREELALKDGRIKFGSKFIEGAITYTPDLHRKFLMKYDIEDIYAFDNFIFNVDRKNQKPNILFVEKDNYLIDHELSLSVNERTIELYNQNHWLYNYKNHIFYNLLKSGTKKSDYFSTFEENLKRLNVNKIKVYADQLLEYGHPVGSLPSIIEYLNYIKSSSNTFVNLLKETINE